jgi:hypothetical protein
MPARLAMNEPIVGGAALLAHTARCSLLGVPHAFGASE